MFGAILNSKLGLWSDLQLSGTGIEPLVSILNRTTEKKRAIERRRGSKKRKRKAKTQQERHEEKHDQKGKRRLEKARCLKGENLKRKERTCWTLGRPDRARVSAKTHPSSKPVYSVPHFPPQSYQDGIKYGHSLCRLR